MEPQSTQAKSTQLAGGSVLLALAILMLIAGIPGAALIAAILSAIAFWMATRVRSTPTT